MEKKLKLIIPWSKSPGMKKMLLCMKLTLVISLVAVLQTWAAVSYSQTTTLSINLKNATVQTVLQQVEDQSEFYFLYSRSLINVDRTVDVQLKDAKIAEVLKALFGGTDVAYKVDGRQIVLSRKSESSAFDMQQQKSISGKVSDSSGGALPGVSVVVKGTTNGTITDANGNYTISKVPENSILQFSFVGMKGHEMEIGNKSVINVTMEEETIGLDEVVAIGYGKLKKSDLTGAVGSVRAEDFQKGVFTAPNELIQGKVSGVQIINNSGQPGGAATVKIRGNSAVSGNGQPLYVVDGVPLDNRSARPGLNVNGLGNTPDGNPLNFLNPSDIASIEVLKDASATAIYGSRGAFGVVIINTKRGQSGQPKIEVGSSSGVSTIMKKIEVLNADQFREAIKYYGVSALNDQGGNANGLDAILRQGIQQNYTLAVSGGSETGKYRLSAGYLNQEGIIKKSGFKKYNSNFSTNLKFLDSKKLGLDINVNTSQYVEDMAYITNDAGFEGSLIQQALQWNPTLNLRKDDGSLNILPGTVVNPLAMSELYNDNSKVTTVLGSISPYYKFNNWLEYRMLYSVNYSTGTRRSSIHQDINLASTLGKGWASIGNKELSTQQCTHTLNFTKEIFPELNLNALAGFEYMKYSNKGSNMSALGTSNGFGNYGLDYTDYIQYSNATGRIISSFVDPDSELQSYFGRAMVNYMDKYLLTATFRADGSSKFGANNKYGYFPSFSAAWNVSKEKFFKVDFINSLKIRAGWGKTGNQEFPAGVSQAKYSFTNNGGLGQVNNPNPDLKWQSDMQYNVGFDLSVLNSRVTATFDYFNKTTTDLLFPSAPIQPAPPSSVTRWMNLDGNIENKGLEASINATIIHKDDFSWDFGANVSFIKNLVSGLSAPIYTGILNGQGLSGVMVEVIQNGLPINTFFTRKYTGMDSSTGMAVYEDAGNKFYNVGNPNPKALLGLSTTLRYKKLSFTVNMNGAFGHDIYNNTLNSVLNVGSINGGKNIGLAIYQNPVKEAIANPVTASSRFIEKGDYLKLSNATLTYKVGDLAKVIKGFTVYVTGQNLFVITKYTGFDPEVNVNKSVNDVPSLGIDYTPYPSARSINVGVNFSL